MPTVETLIEKDQHPVDLAKSIWDRVQISPAQLEAIHVLIASHRILLSARRDVITPNQYITPEQADDRLEAADEAYAIALNRFISLCSHLEV